MLYLSIVFIGAIVYAASGMDFTTGLSASIACMGNVGPGFGVVGSMGNLRRAVGLHEAVQHGIDAVGKVGDLSHPDCYSGSRETLAVINPMESF